MGGSGNLTVNDSASGISGGWLSVNNQYVGKAGTGVFAQSGGTNDAANYYLGFNAGDNGAGNLGGTGQLWAPYQYVGYNGTGSFAQSGGTSTVFFLQLGYNAGGSGTYSLSGSGLLSPGYEYVGYSGTGNFTQSAGTNSSSSVFSPGNLYLGYSAGGSGTYSLGGSGLLSMGSEYVGYSGAGELHTVRRHQRRRLQLFPEPWPLPRLQRRCQRNLQPRWFRPFVRGGLNTSAIPARGASPSPAAPTMPPPATFPTPASVSATTPAAAGPTASVVPACCPRALSSSATRRGDLHAVRRLQRYLGHLNLGYNTAGGGTYSLSGSGQLSAGQECVGCTGTGNFTQSGGTNVVGTLFLSNNPISAGGSGTYSLSGSGLLSAGQEYIGYSGTGNFTQSGGTNAVGTLFLGVGVPVNGSGTYSLSGSGLLSAGQEYVGFVNGTGNFTQSGGTNAVGTLYLGASSGTYSLNGGMLITSSLSYGWANTPFNFGGGTLQADSSFTTALPMTLTGSGGDATVDTAGYTVILGGSISGPGGLTKTDSGTLVLAAANTYSGDTLISGGTLQLTNALALQNSTFNTSGSGSMNFSDLGAATLGGLSGSGNLALINTANAAVALTTGGNNATTIYSGMLSGTGSLNKTGSGALVLTGYNTYTGGTTVAGGILQFNGDSTVPSGGTIAIQSGAAVALAQTGNYSTVTGWLGSGKITRLRRHLGTDCRQFRGRSAWAAMPASAWRQRQCHLQRHAYAQRQHL